MNILRRFKGFTTNSSSAAEWTPPSDLLNKDAATDGKTAENAPANVANSAMTEKRTESAPGTASRLSENVTIIAGFALAVVGVFVVERLIRRLLRNRRAR